MIKAILGLRLLQASRIFRSIGPIYGLFLLLLYPLIIYKLFYSHSKADHSLLAGVLGLSVLNLHLVRTDGRFLKIVYSNKVGIIKAIEYNLGLIFFSFPLLFGDYPLAFVYLHIGAILLAFVNVSAFKIPNLSFQFVPSVIPRQLFEWRSGMRKYQFVIYMLYSLCIGLGFWHYGSFILLGIITFIFAFFYLEFEPSNILMLRFDNSRDFLLNKVKLHLKAYCIFALPIITLYFFLHPGYIIFYCSFLLVYILNFVVFILNKYKSYIPNGYNNSNTAIMVLQFLMFPISVVLIFVFYKKAVTNLDILTNARN